MSPHPARGEEAEPPAETPGGTPAETSVEPPAETSTETPGHRASGRSGDTADTAGEGGPRRLRVAACQLNATDDRPRNLRAADQLTRRAAGQGAQLVVLPEKWNLLAAPATMAAATEPLDGPSITWARETARELGIDLVAGSISEAAPAGGTRGFNTSVHVGPDGNLRAVYRKVHLFDVQVGTVTYRESEHEQPGDTAVTSCLADNTPVGLAICYDLRFPELFRVLALDGARVLTLPSAFTVPTTRDHWEVLLRARAIENQTFVVAANQTGAHPGVGGRTDRTGGRSMIIDPWGLVLAQAHDRETVIVADLDLDHQEVLRGRLPALTGRMPTAYRGLHPSPSPAVMGG